MSAGRSRADTRSLLDAAITRRDFVSGALLGAGAALLTAQAPAVAQSTGPGWTGPGGVGDYRFSNGNTADVVSAAHRIRDGVYDHGLSEVIETGERYDALIVGSGFSGLSALYAFKKSRPNGRCLMLDNHPIFGGEAKQNEFDVAGYRLTGPQGSNNFPIPDRDPAKGANVWGGAHDLWTELGLPERYEFAEPQGVDPSIVFDKTNFLSMSTDAAATVGYFFQNELTGGEGRWIKSIWESDLKHAPVDPALKRDLLAFRDYRTPYQRTMKIGAAEPWGPYLDGMSFERFVTQVMRLDSRVLRYADHVVAALFGCSSDSISAYTLSGSSPIGLRATHDDLPWISFPGGNTTLARHFVKAVFPDAIVGPASFAAIANNPVNFAALDRADSTLRMRLSATALRVTHAGDPRQAERVEVIYEKGGRLYRVEAGGVVLAIGSWVARHIAPDVSFTHQQALASIPHGPILSVNVALRQWRFLDKLGISAARWFDGFGFFANIRQPMLIGDRPTPFHPDKPIVLTLYVPFPKPGLPVEAQGPAGRAELYGTSYAEFEHRIVEQLQRLFGRAGFDPRRDVAGIVLNRWGHAYYSPPPGFYFGKDGKPPPWKVLQERSGRITFGHSEVSGTDQTWDSAASQGARAMTQLLEVI
ncbi:MAG TPA: NAD(P)-binding protein [Terriglobales bacterium]|nr:NAD(P)-binding protein [Terriglobales bacterium]